jgi:transposase
MKYVGIDLHKKSISLCAVDKDRKVLARREFNTQSTAVISKWFQDLGEFQAVIEATASYEWLFQLLEPLADRVVLADPQRMRVIAESKNKSDKLDAQVLAEFLAADWIPLAHRPTPRQRAHKRLVGQRLFIKRQQTALRCRIRSILAEYNADVPELFTPKGLEYLKKLTLDAEDRFVVSQMLREWRRLGRDLSAINERLSAFAKKAPAPEAEARAVLKTIPGVGPVTIDVVISELGDIRRFRSAKQVTAYAGLAPGYRESGGKRKELNITKKGSPRLRWALVEAAWRLVARTALWRARFERLKKGRGVKRAIVALARRLLCTMVAMLKSAQAYRLAA